VEEKDIDNLAMSFEPCAMRFFSQNSLLRTHSL
jgi:hypothetical protein